MPLLWLLASRYLDPRHNPWLVVILVTDTRRKQSGGRKSREKYRTSLCARHVNNREVDPESDI